MHRENWALRKATFNDAQAISALMHAAYRGYSARLPSITLPPLAANYEEEIRANPVWVAESDAAIIGGLILMPEQACMTIVNIAVDPRYQGKGVGRALELFAFN